MIDISGIVGNFLSAGLGVGMAFAWYTLYGRRAEKKWILSNGLLYYMYFRNVDWRCEKIRKVIVSKGIDADDVWSEHLIRELNKLRNDVGCLDRITELWSDRVAAVLIWYPYSKRVQELLTASSLLSMSLVRHLDPLLWVFSNRDFAGATHLEDKTQKDFDAYLSYFMNNGDRLWGSGSANGNSRESVIIAELQESGKLFNRLQCVLTCARELLQKEASVPIDDKHMGSVLTCVQKRQQ